MFFLCKITKFDFFFGKLTISLKSLSGISGVRVETDSGNVLSTSLVLFLDWQLLVLKCFSFCLHHYYHTNRIYLSYIFFFDFIKLILKLFSLFLLFWFCLFSLECHTFLSIDFFYFLSFSKAAFPCHNIFFFCWELLTTIEHNN